MTPEQLRQEFERPYPIMALKKYPDGEYVNQPARVAWDNFQRVHNLTQWRPILEAPKDREIIAARFSSKGKLLWVCNALNEDDKWYESSSGDDLIATSHYLANAPMEIKK